MPKTMPKTILRLVAVGCFAFLMLNFPLLSIYHGTWFGFPALLVAIFGIWLLAILLAMFILEDRWNQMPLKRRRSGLQ
jgi:hypothetical protein